MGWDVVSFSLKSKYKDNTVYNTWLNRLKNGNTKDFKEYLLSSDENLQLFAKHFDEYQEGDMFVKSSVVELADGKLLCFDADQAQAYIIDLENIDKTHDTICMTKITPNDTTISYDKQIENIISKLNVELREDKLKTKDGTKIDYAYITENLLASKSLNLYQEAVGISSQSSTGETSTIDKKNLHQIYFNNLDQMTTNEDEQEYYKTLLQSLGVNIEPDKNIVDNTGVIQNINKKINLISENLSFSNTSSTLSTRAKSNLIEIYRRLSLSEMTLIEQLNPGLLTAIGEFIGDTYHCVTDTDKYGRTTSISESITWADVMREKAEMENDPLAYLRYEDRINVTTTLRTYEDAGIKKIDIDGKAYKISKGDKDDWIIQEDAAGAIEHKTNKDNKVTIDGVTYEVVVNKQTQKITQFTVNTADYQIKTGKIVDNMSINEDRTTLKVDAAKQLATGAVKKAKAGVDVENYVDNNQSDKVSDTTIEAYLDEFKGYFDTKNFPPTTKEHCKKPDEALMFLARLRDPEVAFKLLANPDVQKAINMVGYVKGTNPGAQGQTPQMYYVGEDGNVGVDAKGELATKAMPLTVENVAKHLGILTEVYRSRQCDENGNYIAGDQERIDFENATKSIEKLLDGLTNGWNVEYTDNGTGQAWTAGGIAGAAGLTLVGAGTAKIVTAAKAAKALKAAQAAVKAAAKAAAKAAKAAETAETLKAIETAAQTGKTAAKAAAQAAETAAKAAETAAKTAANTAKTAANTAKTAATTAKTAATAAKAVAGGTIIVAGAALGGVAGNWIGDQIIKNDTSGDFLDQYGNPLEQKAKNFKTLTTISGAGTGAAVGAGAALALGLVTNPIGWGVLIVGALVGVAVGIGAWLYKKNG